MRTGIKKNAALAAANNRNTINKENQMKNDDTTLRNAREKIEAMSRANEPSYWGTSNRHCWDYCPANAVLETADLDEKTFKENHPDLGHVYTALIKSLDELQEKGKVNAADFCVAVVALEELFVKGARVLIPTLISDVFAAYILGIETEELHSLKCLHAYRFKSGTYYFNTEIYDYLDGRRNGRQKGTKGATSKN